MKNYFSKEELKCQCGEFSCEFKNEEIDPVFLSHLNIIREEAGFPFIVTSGLRCPDYNAHITSTNSRVGPHTKKRAVDILAHYEKAYIIVKLATEFGFTGIGINQKGASHQRFIHLDDLTPEDDFPTRPTIWTY